MQAALMDQAGEFIQVGVAATRNHATGGFDEPVALYIQATDAAKESARGLAEDIAHLFAAKYRLYVESQGAGA